MKYAPIKVALVICVLLIVTGCSGSASPVPGSNVQALVGGDESSRVIEIGERRRAPDISGTTLEADELSLSDYEGKVVVVNVWGSWCAPCRAEAPILQEVYEDFRARGVEFLGLDTRDQNAAALAFEKTFGITYPSLVDSTGELQLAFRDSWPPNAVPSTLVIDRNGLIAAAVVGPTTYSQLSGLVRKVTAERR